MMIDRRNNRVLFCSLLIRNNAHAIVDQEIGHIHLICLHVVVIFDHSRATRPPLRLKTNLAPICYEAVCVPL
jgi:hypothetical protein